MNDMKLIGSRNLGIHNETSDWDYVALDLTEGDTFQNIINERIGHLRHCYHFNKDYRYGIARFENTDENDWHFIYNAEDYKAGVIDVNPLEYREQWLHRLKTMDFYNPYWFKHHFKTPSKKAYHIVYNLEILKVNSLDISDEAMARVKMFHDRQATAEDYETIIREINELT
jgi:hypothetical protein